MTPEEFQKYYPRLLGWIDTTLRAHAENARTVASRGFPRLPVYFSANTLMSAKVVSVDELPIPPLSSWGLTRFADFERGNFNGVTYLNTFFIKRDDLRNEAIYFHELIHVIQWRILGPEQFLTLYADGLERLDIEIVHWKRWHTMPRRHSRQMRSSMQRRWWLES